MEIELKYPTDPETGKKIMEEVAGSQGSAAREIPMLAIYYDTEDRALRDKRLTYRIRKEGKDNILTIKYGRGSDKGNKGLHRREEINIPVPADFIEKPGIDVLDDTPVYKEFDKAVGGQYSDDLGVMLPLKPLIPLMEMEYLRTEADISFGEGGRTKAVISYDEGEIRAGGKTEPISEVEIELSDGFEEDLTEFGEVLSKKYGIEGGNKSKYARGLKLLEIK